MDKDDWERAGHHLVDFVQIGLSAVGYVKVYRVRSDHRHAISRQVLRKAIGAPRIRMRAVFGRDHNNRGRTLTADRGQRHKRAGYVCERFGTPRGTILPVLQPVIIGTGADGYRE